MEEPKASSDGCKYGEGSLTIELLSLIYKLFNDAGVEYSRTNFHGEDYCFDDEAMYVKLVKRFCTYLVLFLEFELCYCFKVLRQLLRETIFRSFFFAQNGFSY